MKKLIITFLVWSRLLTLWRYWHRRRITILSLHGVEGPCNESTWSPLWGRPSTEQIRSVIRQLRNYYTFISLDKAVSILEGSSPAVEHGLVLTFDDGYRNNFSDALPLLDEMGVPATFFIATGFVESGKSYWVDRLDYALQHAPVSKRVLIYKGREFDFRGNDRRELARRYRELRVSIKKNECDDDEMMRVVDGFFEMLEAASEFTIKDIIDTDPFVSIATWAEQRAACEGTATIGSHSVDHCRLTSIPEVAVDEQLAESKKVIEDKVGNSCDLFCYPNGSHNDYVVDRVKTVGYRAAVTTKHGLNRVGDDLHTLKRHPMPLSDDVRKNLLLISGIFESNIGRALRVRR